MIMNNASHAGYTTWQTPQSIIDKRNKEKQKAEKEKDLLYQGKSLQIRW